MENKTISELRQGASCGDANCEYKLAMRHIYGDGVEEDNNLAFALLKKAAMQKHIEAMYNLAICYHYGYGTEIDLNSAFDLYMECAKNGYGKGMELVGRFYNRGIFVSVDRAKAKFWLEKAMKSDDIEAAGEASKEIKYTIE